MNSDRLQIAVIGGGLIGRRRASCAASHKNSHLAFVVDADTSVADALALEYGVRTSLEWRDAIADPNIDIVVVATPNGYLAEIAIAALGAGKHVLVEKPMGRNIVEATAMAEAARKSGKILKIGFNHRYHPALASARERFCAGEIGELINLRARYGHGGRPGYEREWRGNAELAGGGELTDQGVHVADLIHWFAGLPNEAFAYTQTAIWPIAPLEDNAFALFRFENGAVASFHTSWTQWKNMFSFEVFGTKGSLSIEGLGKSYGIERLISAKRRLEGGVPEIAEESFEGDDLSWQYEWNDFMNAVQTGEPYWGSPADGLAAMRMLAALYGSVEQGRPVPISGL
uniref:Putative dehydrogenase n=1 Tax=mine drainage metagenome TaxID=410659 RepID=E6Q5T1_9ZZZZ